MATRDDILTELHLAPEWRLRATPGLAPLVTPREAHAAPTETLRTNPIPPEATEAPVEYRTAPETGRSARIAALTWTDFAADVATCNACGLCRTRRKTVPGVGDVHAEWLFVGEAPGADEDAQGEPFVGQAGRLLDNMLAALGLARGANVYIANVQKCRPPGNRTPEPAEIDACGPYLDRQIELIQPKLIVALGKCAATTLLGVDATIASMRGRVHRYGRLPLIVTYHPAYLLRTLPDKAKAWEDLLFARRTMAKAAAAVEAAPAADSE